MSDPLLEADDASTPLSAEERAILDDWVPKLRTVLSQIAA